MDRVQINKTQLDQRFKLALEARSRGTGFEASEATTLVESRCAKNPLLLMIFTILSHRCSALKLAVAVTANVQTLDFRTAPDGTDLEEIALKVR
jgi:hypothetical protein